jgi:hypothetical protein
MTNEYLLDRNYHQYTDVEEFKNYELINCVVYEMAVRNLDVLILSLIWNILSKNISLTKKLEKFILKRKKDFNFLNNKENIFEDINLKSIVREKLEDSYFFNIQSNEKWINYYNFSPVYNLKFNSFNECNNNLEKNSHSYNYIECHSQRNIHTGFLVETSLSFIHTIETDKKDFNFHEVKRSIKANFSRPVIKASKNFSKLSSLEYINFALPEKELVSYILHLKKEFNKNYSILPTLSEITLEKHYKIEDINNFNSIDWADCFFIYDYYQKSTFSINETAKYLQEIFNKYHGIKINKLKFEIKKGESKTKYIPFDFYIENKDKFLKQNRIINDYYSISTIKSRYKLMQIFIENLGYKTLIGG